MNVIEYSSFPFMESSIIVGKQKFVRARDIYKHMAQERLEYIKFIFPFLIDRIPFGKYNLEKFLKDNIYTRCLDTFYIEGFNFRFIYIILNSNLIKDELFDFTLLEDISSY